MRNGILTLLIFCGLSFAGEAPAETNSPVTLDPVNVQAGDADFFEVVLDRQKLRRGPYRTTPQALREIPGVMVQETSHGQGSPYIRGFTGFRNLFTIDGIRLNNSVFRSGPNQYWNTVDPYLIQRLVVEKGTSGVLGGSDAIGGSVNAVTRSALDYDANGSALYRVSSAENSHQGRLESGIRVTEDFAVLAGLTRKHFGDLRGGQDIGLQRNTGYEEWDVDLKLEQRLPDDAALALAYQQSSLADVPRTHRTVFSRSFAGTAVGGELQRSLDQRRQLAYLQLRDTTVNEWIDQLTLSASWQQQDEARYRERTGARFDHQGFTVNTLGLWARAESDSRIGRLAYGVDYYRDFVRSYSSGSAIQGPVGDDASYDLLGVYLQDRVSLTPRWDWSVGGRYNYSAARAGSVRDPLTTARTSISRSWNSAVGDTRLLWKAVPERLDWLFTVAQGFRAPNLSDLTRFDISRSGETETASFDLEPEKYLSFETGLRWRQPRATAELNSFYTIIDDQIVRFPTGAMIGGMPEVTKGNVGDGYVQGIELGLAWEAVEQWTLFGNLAWVEGRVDTFPTAAPVVRREYLDRLMPLTGQLGLRWESRDDRWWSEALGVIAADADKLSTRDAADAQRIPPGGTPGYAIMHLRGGWNVTKNFSASAAVENLFDADYRIHGSGQNMPGRNFILELTARF